VEDLSKTSAASHYQLVRCHWDDSAILICYRHKLFNVNEFLCAVKDAILQTKENHIILIGDFNVNLIKDNTFNLRRFFSVLQLESSLKNDESTTDYGTQIDCVFTNVQLLHATVWETYYSYHKGICVNW
jgi:endonuclease/exonuclease/phosphatase (EEP) superfamily protein YafD